VAVEAREQRGSGRRGTQEILETDKSSSPPRRSEGKVNRKRSLMGRRGGRIAIIRRRKSQKGKPGNSSQARKENERKRKIASWEKGKRNPGKSATYSGKQGQTGNGAGKARTTLLLSKKKRIQTRTKKPEEGSLRERRAYEKKGNIPHSKGVKKGEETWRDKDVVRKKKGSHEQLGQAEGKQNKEGS